MPVVDAATLQAFAERLLEAAGARPEEARRVAESLVGADLRGYQSHGVMRIPYYAQMLERGDIVAGAELTVISETPSLVAADGNWGFGQVQALRLTERLLDKAAAVGAAVGTLRRSAHIGRLGEYGEQAARRAMAAIVMANTHGAAIRVAPPGGRAPRLGTNPIAVAVPHNGEPLVLDFSTSATAEGKVRIQKLAGQPCPPGWLLDNRGRPTTDPNALYADPPGTIRPMGGDQPYKGFGLALMIDILAGALSGGLCSRETPITPKGNCALLVVLNPEKFAGAEHFAAETGRLVQFVRECPLAEGAREILLPGDPERRTLAERSASGVPLDDANWAQLTELAQRLGVAPP